MKATGANNKWKVIARGYRRRRKLAEELIEGEGS